MQNQTCFLLSYLKYGDNDAILHCFSEDSGFQSFFAKGIYSARNKKKAYLFPLNKINITVIPSRNSRAIKQVSKIEMVSQDYGFDDVKINTVLLFVSDFLNQVLKNETHQNTVFTEIERFCAQLYSGNYDSYSTFIFRILSCQGLSPLMGEGNFLDPETGNFTALQSHSLYDEEISEVWKILGTSSNIYDVRLKRQVRKSFLNSLMTYYKIHFSGFYEPNSLDIIQQIYE